MQNQCSLLGKSFIADTLAEGPFRAFTIDQKKSRQRKGIISKRNRIIADAICHCVRAPRHAVMSFSGGRECGCIVYSMLGSLHVAIDWMVSAAKCVVVLKTYLLARLLIKTRILIKICTS